MARVQVLKDGSEVVLARPNGLRECDGCGIHYRPSFDESKFCSTCIGKGLNIPERQCARCGITFQPHHASAIYHSNSCRQLAYKARKDAEVAA